MSDIGRLITVLGDYHNALDAQHKRVSEAHRQLSDRYRALSAVYEGAGAAEFKAGWQQVMAAFDAYADGVPNVLGLLENKIEQLRALDQGL